jgi:hypothetical protein
MTGPSIATDSGHPFEFIDKFTTTLGWINAFHAETDTTSTISVAFAEVACAFDKLSVDRATVVITAACLGALTVAAPSTLCSFTNAGAELHSTSTWFGAFAPL